jgi:hypothetical protein
LTCYPNWGGLELSFWAVFGWMNVLADEGVYDVIRLVDRLAILGLVLSVAVQWQKRRLPNLTLWGMGLLGLWFLLTLAMLLRYMQTLKAAQGRLLFPAISAISLFLFLGLAQFVPKRYTGALATTIGVGMFLLAAITPFRYIAPAYARPPLLSEADLASIPNRLNFDYEGWMRLLGYKADGNSYAGYELTSVRPGENLQVTLYWEALKPMEQNYSVFIHLHGQEGILAQRDSYPGKGNFATSLWQPEDRLADAYRLTLPVTATAPALLDLRAGLYRYETRQRLQAFDAQGKALGPDPLIGRVKLVYNGPTGLPLHFRLGDQVALIGYELDIGSGELETLYPLSSLRLTLYWQAEQHMERDYTVFVHLADTAGRRWAQGDQQPLGGRYPTSIWDVGEVVRDEYHLNLSRDMPPGEYRLLVGMYLLETMQRLATVDGGGKAVPEDAIPVVTIRVVKP